VISPTIGRRVWFWPNGCTAIGSCSNFVVIDKAQAFDAGVVYVWNDRMVNLDVADHYGKHFPASSVPLLQDDDPVPEFGFYATWMPYQQQAAKTATSGAAA
jgi:hypothetical protein